MARLQPAPFDPVAHARKLARTPGASWRFQTHDSVKARSLPGARRLKDRFDEVVVDDWLHAEMMDTRSCFVTVGNLALWLHLTDAGALVTNAEIRDDAQLDYGLRSVLREALRCWPTGKAIPQKPAKSRAFSSVKKPRVSEKSTPKTARKASVQKRVAR